MILDNQKLNPIYVPIIHPPAGVINEYFYKVPGASDYALSDYGRLYKKTESGNYHKVNMTFFNGDDAYPIQFDEESEYKIVPVRKLMAITFFPNKKGIYLQNPAFAPFSDPTKRWSLYNLHTLVGRDDLVEYILAKIEQREPNYDDSKKHITFKNRPEFNESFRKVVNRTRSNMRSRATNPGTKARNPRYIDTTIDEDLGKSSQLLGQWILDNWYDYPAKLEIDKDVLGYGGTNRYDLDHIALLPSSINNIFVRKESKYGYGIQQRRKLNGEKYFYVSGDAYQFNGYRPAGVRCNTYTEALQAGRKMKADYIRRIVNKERSDGYIPEKILEAMEKWAARCELGYAKIFEPSEEILHKMGVY